MSFTEKGVVEEVTSGLGSIVAAERELTEDNQAPRSGTRAARKRKSTPGSGEPWKLLAQVEGKWRPCSCNIPSDSAVAVAAGLRGETERSGLVG